MKGLSNVLTTLKTIIKYGAYFGVAIKILQFAHDEVSKLDLEKDKENE